MNINDKERLVAIIVKLRAAREARRLDEDFTDGVSQPRQTREEAGEDKRDRDDDT